MSDNSDLLSFPVDIIEHETASVLRFDRASEIERYFELSEPLSADDLADVVRIGREGIVHAAICPFMEEIYSKRRLMLADSAERLAHDFKEACDDI